MLRHQRREVYKNPTISPTKTQETLTQHTIYVSARWIRKFLHTKIGLRSYRPAKNLSPQQRCERTVLLGARITYGDGRQVGKSCSGVTRAASNSFPGMKALSDTQKDNNLARSDCKAFPFINGLGLYGQRT